MAASTHPLSVKEWPEQGQWSYEDWARLPDDGNRYEVIDGVLHILPMPYLAHQRVVSNLLVLLMGHIDTHQLGHLFMRVGVRLPVQPIPFVPDFVFIRAGRNAIIGEDFVEGVPDLVVEILSPEHSSYERQDRFRIYEEAGVPETWLVDYEARTVEVFVLEEGEYALLGKWSADEPATSHILPGFQLPVARLFRNL